MKSNARAWLVHVTVTAVTASGLSWPTALAQSPAAAGRIADATVAAHPTPEAAAWTVVSGRAWHADDTPVPNAKLRLRNVTTGRVAAVTVTNVAGEFTFADISAGTYIVELLSEGGKIIGISGVVTVQRGESVATFVRESTRGSSFRAL